MAKLTANFLPAAAPLVGWKKRQRVRRSGTRIRDELSRGRDQRSAARVIASLSPVTQSASVVRTGDAWPDLAVCIAVGRLHS
eukprot:4228268-Pleurochrysis_carterae.AAC.8